MSLNLHPGRNKSYPLIEGFLVPQAYKNQTIYKTRPLFRSALPLLILTIGTVVVCAVQYFDASKLKAETLITQNLVTQESQKLILQSATFKQTRDKLKELDSLKQHIRVPTSPILDAVEKTIPDPIAVTKITLNCPPTATTATAPRKATVILDAYFPQNVSPNDEIYQKWPEALIANLNKSGLTISNFEWSIQRKYIPPFNTTEPSSKTKESYGRTKELILTVEFIPTESK